MNLSINNEKCFMLMIERIVLRHHILASSIKVNHDKISIIQNLTTPQKKLMFATLLDILVSIEDSSMISTK
jgi:hypothetical protein